MNQTGKRRSQGSTRRPFFVKFTPALLPATFTARAVVRQGGSEACYRSDWTEAGTRAPLDGWTVGGRRMLAGLGPVTADGRAWLTDLDVVQTPSLIAVRAHGDDRGQVLAVQTTWFLHLRDCPEEIWCLHTLETRRAPLAWDVVSPAAGLRVEGPGIRVRRRTGTWRLSSPEGERWLWRLTAGAAKPWLVDVAIQPPENERGFVDARAPFELVVHLTNRSSRALIGATLRVYGLGRGPKVPVDLAARGTARVSLPVAAGARRGIVPVAVRFEHPLAVGVGARSLWLPRVTITSDQPWLDGMIAENLRSAVHRFTFNTWREDEPRYPCYRDGVFNRNIHTALIALDDPRRLWGWVRLWLMALRSCGFMPEAFGLAVPPLRDLAWLDRPLVIGNDGTGFTMIQWGKLFLRADDALRRDMLRHDLADLRLLARAVQRALHWTGQIEDHSEPVEGIRTDRYLAGSPYAQALCLAGALLVRRALALANSPAAEVRQLAELYAGLAKRLREGLDRASAKDGRFMDITSDQNQRHPHTYTNLAPGMILTDPDLGEEAYADRAVLERTLKANVVYHPKGRPYRVLTCPYWPPHPGLSHNAYSQIAAIINCLALEREKEAASYLDDLIRCTRADFTRHMLSDPKYTLHDWQVETRDFARFIIPEGVVPGHDAIKINPGNGVNVSYFLYLVDRMVGITPRAGHIEIAPQPAGQRRWEVADYPTRLGSVSYRLERERGVIRFWCATGAPAQLGLPVGPRASLVVDGRPYRPGRGAAAVTAGRAWLRLSPGTHTVVAHTAGSLPATVGTAVPDQKF